MTKINEEKENKKFFPGLGRRKSAIARVRIFAGQGEIIINDKKIAEYFPYFELNEIIKAPLELVGEDKKNDVSVKILGGGPKSQAEAIRLGVARALVIKNEAYKQPLRAAGFLTRDPRVKERKKPGLKRARRAPQWVKR
jgi:small subunit ribosomal protein S9